MLKFCGKARFPHSFGWYPKAMWKLCLFTKSQHQEIRWNYGILRNDLQWSFFSKVNYSQKQLKVIVKTKFICVRLISKYGFVCFSVFFFRKFKASTISRGVFRTQWNIYDGYFQRSRYLFSQKDSTVDVWFESRYDSEVLIRKFLGI